MPTKTKEQAAADIIASSKELLDKVAPKKTKATAAQKEQARKARAGARIAKDGTKSKKSVSTPKASAQPTAGISTASRSELAGTGGVMFTAADYITGDIWTPNPAIPAIDEATYETYKTQAEGQSRSLEVASLNLKNINSVHKLEGQAADIAITAKNNETKWAKLEGAEIDYQTQIQVNGAKTQKLTQATAAHEFAGRETQYLNSQIDIRDEHFQLEIQQAQNVFAEKSARYRAQLTGQ
ncbi:MAG: hypothetical protein WBD47_14070 [Phormidesmis sp.]